ncbi:glycosyl hydrolase family 95 catalytic domain-containing protein [Aporhodopirellula aestuarii]|uniref:Dienelactone hydrolase family protein n=1 Tax=Aporhodopirellula aestuarii TaxID=2950107 RepID=A0ABT0UDD7_9BACT|nr:dienelactone hydrolase family protein [Aporhodopirellula aestuarii]MCM2375058.1 dienelactone hydrolase family protein [Aporhodopirellula aestuarii]
MKNRIIACLFTIVLGWWTPILGANDAVAPLETLTPQETLAPLDNDKPPTTVEALWADFDPRAEPLDVEILKEWEEDNVVLRVVRFHIGTFKGKKAMLAGIYGFPKGAKNLPGLLQIHGGGQYADHRAPLANAKRGYATISISWAGRISAPGYRVTPAEVKLFWDGKTDEPNYRLTTDWGAVDGYHAPSRNSKNVFPQIPDPASWTLDDVKSPRNNSWFLCTLAARRALTFLEQQPQVDANRLGVYGHSMGGKLTVLTAGADARVKAAVPSCGGISDRDNDDPLFRATLGDDAYLKRIRCPILFQSPANDFHGRINDLQTALTEIQTDAWRATCSPHHNHQDTKEYEVASLLWFDQHLRGTFQSPTTPATELKLGATPQFSVKPDQSQPVLAVDVFYTRQGQIDGEKDDHENSKARYWQHAKAVKQGDVWIADLPLFGTDKPLWVYANVLYPLDQPVSGAGYYYGEYTTEQFNLSSRMEMISAEKLKASGATSTLEATLQIESFEGEWTKGWFTYRPHEWDRKTHKVYDPRWKAPEGAKLAFDVKAARANTMVVGIDDYAIEVEVQGDAAWQKVLLSPADFKNAAGESMSDWDGIRELRLGTSDRLTSNVGGNTTRITLGSSWQGAPPEFRNLCWSKQQIAADVDYKAFLGQHDMLWDRIPNRWEVAPYTGNGNVGFLFYQAQDEAKNVISIYTGRHDYYDHREPHEGHELLWIYRSRLPLSHFKLTSQGDITAVNLRLDLWNAELTGTIETDKGSYGVRGFSHSLHDVIYFETDANDESVNVSWHPDVPKAPVRTTLEAGGGPKGGSWDRMREAPYELPPSPTLSEENGQRFCYQPLYKNRGETTTGWEVSGTPDQKQILLASVHHSFPEHNSMEIVKDNLHNAKAMLADDRFFATHRKWWNEYYPLSFLTFNDAEKETFYWIQMYKFASATRGNGPVMDLMGPWYHKTFWPMVWGDLNVELQYWTHLTANRLDVGSSLVNWFDKHESQLFKNVPEHWKDSAGLSTLFPQDLVAHQGASVPDMLCWILHDYWLHCQFAGDGERMRTGLFSKLRGVGNSYLNYLNDNPVSSDDGKIHIKNSWSPEYPGGRGQDINFTIGLMKWCFQTLLDINEQHELNDPLADQWKNIVDNLVDFQIDESGLRIGKDIPFDKPHRHYSHLLPFYPLAVLTPDTREDKELLRTSLEHWLDVTFNSGIKVTAMPVTGYTATGAASMYAWLGDQERAYHYLDFLIKHNRVSPTTMYAEGNPVIESPLSFATCIHDMLLQSWGGVLRVFPASPQVWGDVAFKDLRGQGAFLVSAKKQDGVTQFVTVKSLIGSPCVVWTDIPNPKITIGGSPAEATVRADGSYELSLEKGETVTFSAGSLALSDMTINPIPVAEADRNLFGLNEKTKRLPGHQHYYPERPNSASTSKAPTGTQQTLPNRTGDLTGGSWMIASQADWEQNCDAQTNLEIKDGLASPTAKTATYRSVLKRFDAKKKPESILIEQSPVWQNWEPAGDIGPGCTFDSPVFLSLGPKNYWMFARHNRGAENKSWDESTKGKFVAESIELEGFDVPLLTTPIANQFRAPGGLKRSLNGYHAWESRDMKNWVHHGPITDLQSQWMTTAEYVDGKAYFYYDFPNDQDPHLIIDSDLTDGEVGEKRGIAFEDPSHGSDCAFIRDLEGNFHVIYEDWSPIHANSHSFDSPLAGHAVSKDGKGDFKILAPAVDHRTKPTGVIKTYKHPHWVKECPERFQTDIGEYEVHEPEQNAYGDWAAICIGGRYYLFGDYDPAGSHGSRGSNMSVAWFTSPSLDEPFEFCGHIGQGHPDPDICFAEGRFWLATQPEEDFVSPGPWVERVEVRVGVDTTNDGSIDQWTSWQSVQEQYDYLPGFAKQVAKTPAEMDLTELQAAYGFQFELKLTDSTENESKPILDKVQMNFR